MRQGPCVSPHGLTSSLMSPWMPFRFSTACPLLASALAAVAACEAAVAQDLEFMTPCASAWGLDCGALAASKRGLPKPTYLEPLLLPPHAALPAVDAGEGPEEEKDVDGPSEPALLPKPCIRACKAASIVGKLGPFPFAGRQDKD